MYWSEWSRHCIKRAHLDGTEAEVFVSDVGRTNGLTIDLNDRKLYWTDIDSRRIESIELEGKKIM